MDLLEDKATAALAGAAVGDALGGAAEGNTPKPSRNATTGSSPGSFRHSSPTGGMPGPSRRITRVTGTSPTTP